MRAIELTNSVSEAAQSEESAPNPSRGRPGKVDLLKSILGEDTFQLLSGKAILLDNAKAELRANAASTRVKM